MTKSNAYSLCSPMVILCTYQYSWVSWFPLEGWIKTFGRLLLVYLIVRYFLVVSIFLNVNIFNDILSFCSDIIYKKNAFQRLWRTNCKVVRCRKVLIYMSENVSCLNWSCIFVKNVYRSDVMNESSLQYQNNRVFFVFSSCKTVLFGHNWSDITFMYLFVWKLSWLFF